MVATVSRGRTRLVRFLQLVVDRINKKTVIFFIGTVLFGKKMAALCGPEDRAGKAQP